MKLFKTLIIALVICGLLLGAASPALAVGPGKVEKGRWWEGKVEIVQGKASVSSVSPPAGATDVVNVDSKTIYVSANTTYKVPGLKTAGINDIDGKYIIAQCDKTNSGLWARHVIVVPGKSEGGKQEYGYQHYTGNVTDYNYDPNTGGNITIQDKSGNTIAFQINDGQFKIMPPGATVAVGDWVTVIGHRESPNGPLIAVGVSVYQPRPHGPVHISGQISYINGSIITIVSTNISYNNTTFFVLRGVPGVALNQQATILYTQLGDNKTAKLVLVGVEDLSRIWSQFGEGVMGLIK